MDIDKFKVSIASSVKCVIESYSKWIPNLQYEMMSADDVYSKINEPSNVYDKANYFGTTAKLLMAVESFGSEGCCAKDAHIKGIGTEYVSNGHKFADLGVFLKPAVETERYKSPEFAMIDLRSNRYVKSAVIYIDRISRNNKVKYVLSDMGKTFVANAKKNMRFFNVKRHVAGMQNDEISPIHYLIDYNISNGDDVSLEFLQNELNDIGNDKVLVDRFKSQIIACKRQLNSTLKQLHT